MGLLKRKKKEDGIEKIVLRIKEMYKNSSDNKSSHLKKWKESYEAYNGSLFENKTNKAMGNAIPNHIFATVETIKPIMFSNTPKNVVYPKTESAFEKAQMVQEAMDYEWRRTRLIPKILDSLTNGLVYGTFILGLFWNGKDNKGLGEIEPKVISPFNFFIDPMAESIAGAEYCMYATYKSYGELVKAYPEKAEELEGEKLNNVEDDLSFGETKNNVKNQILYIEAYLRDYATDTYVEEEEDEETGEKKKYKVTKMKYPNGRRVIIAGDVLLDDGENPYNDGKFPFVEWNCYNVPGQFWGLSEVEVLVSVQKEICNLYNSMIANANLMGNPIWILDKNSGVEKGSLTNAKGLVVRKNPGTEVRREIPPSMPGYINELAEKLKYDIQVISGVYDATRGERPVSISSGVAIQALQDSSQGRIRLKTQNLEYMLAELGAMWLSRMQQFWTAPRTIRIMGGEYEPDSAPIVIGGQQVQFKVVDKDMIDGDFDVEILTGSSMPVNKSARLETLLRLAQTPAEDGLPLVNRRTVLKYADIENVEEVIREFDEALVRQQEAQSNQVMEQQMINEQNQKMAHDQELNRMAMNTQSQQQTAEFNHRAKLEQEQMKVQGQMALQEQSNDLQSVIGEVDIDNMTIEELIQFISTLDKQGMEELVRKYPQVLEYLNQLQNLGMEQPAKESKEVK